MLKKIVSGGQTGADRAGLKAGKHMGLETGGWMPKGFIAHDGKHPEFADLYNMKEHSSNLYPPRTFTNARDSDATVRFAVDFTTAGEKLTLTAANQYNKPHFDVDIVGTQTPQDLADWIITNKIEVLNVAGNAERRMKGIEEFVFAFLIETIALTQTTASAT